MNWRRRRIAVLLGGRSSERSISLRTGAAVLASLRRQQCRAVAVDAGGDLVPQLRRHRINLAFIALHGPGGEDGVVQGLLEWMGIPYTGSGVLASAIAMDKSASKTMFASAGLPVARGIEVSPETTDAGRRIGLPAVVKPVSQGSALGVSIVRRASEWAAAFRTAFRYEPRALVEERLDGPEITVGVLGRQVLPVIEIVPVKGRFYDFQSKYAQGGSRHILPARLSPAVTRRAQDYALRACQAIGTRGAARVDLIVDRRRGPVLLEVNTIPGMTPTSLLPEAARAAGLDFDALVGRIAELSLA